MRVRFHKGGFSLIEAVVAAALLALGCLASAGVLHVALRAEASSRQRRAAEQLLDAEAARLAALPFYRVADGPGGAPVSLLGDVFPHALRELNNGEAAFGDESGTAIFVSEAAAEAYLLRRTARLVRDGTGDPQPVPEAEVAGYAVWRDARPPALAVDVTLEVVRAGRGTVARRLLLRALRPALAPTALTVLAPTALTAPALPGLAVAKEPVA